MSKMKTLLQSRRFWTAAVSAVAACVLYALGIITPEKLTTWLEVTIGGYGTAISAEHVAAVLKPGKTDAGREAADTHPSSER